MNIQIFQYQLLKRLVFSTEQPFTFVENPFSLYTYVSILDSTPFWRSIWLFHLIPYCFDYCSFIVTFGDPGGSDSKASVYNAGDLGSIPRSGRSPGEGNGNPLQYNCLENPMDRGAWQATIHGVAKSRTQLSDFTFIIFETENVHISSVCVFLSYSPLLVLCISIYILE